MKMSYGLRGSGSVAGKEGNTKCSLGLVKGEKVAVGNEIRMAHYKHWFMPNLKL